MLFYKYIFRERERKKGRTDSEGKMIKKHQEMFLFFYFLINEKKMKIIKMKQEENSLTYKRPKTIRVNNS